MVYNNAIKRNNVYYSNVPWLDFDNLELMFLYIEDFKQFKQSSINLNAKYNFKYNANTNTLIIRHNKNYVKLYPDNVNLKIFCGKNGAGKSTLIRILRNIDVYNACFVVYKTSKGDFVTNKKDLNIVYAKKKFCCNLGKVSRNGRYFHLNEGEELIDIRHSTNYQADFCTSYLSHYKELNKALGSEYKRYFNYFCIGFNDVKCNSEDLQSSIENKYNLPLLAIEGLGPYFRENPIKFIMLNESFDFSFDNLHIKYSNSKKFMPDINRDINKFFDEILKNIYGLGVFKEIEKLNEEFIDFIYDTSEYKKSLKNEKCNDKSNSCKHFFVNLNKSRLKYQKYNEYFSGYYKKCLEKLKSFKERAAVLYNKPIKQTIDIHFEEYFYFNLFRKQNGENIYFYNFSTGEQYKLIGILNLYYKIAKANNLAQTLIFEDDIDANLHPEWCRSYINSYINSLKLFSKKNKDKIRNIILTTHSPFVLSDTMNDYIEYLEKVNFTTSVKKKTKIANTFAGNIMQMFEDNMFLNASIGEYSIKILKEVINYLDKKPLGRPILLKNSMSKADKDKICTNIINSIGDTILKKILTDKINKSEDGKIRYC